MSDNLMRRVAVLLPPNATPEQAAEALGKVYVLSNDLRSAIEDLIELFAAPRWQPIETAPKDETHVWVWTPEGAGAAWYSDAQPDYPDQMGHDAGWWSVELPCDPGRSIGNPAYMRKPQNQPTYWMPLPEPPAEAFEEEDETAPAEPSA